MQACCILGPVNFHWCLNFMTYLLTYTWRVFLKTYTDFLSSVFPDWVMQLGKFPNHITVNMVRPSGRVNAQTVLRRQKMRTVVLRSRNPSSTLPFPFSKVSNFSANCPYHRYLSSYLLTENYESDTTIANFFYFSD